MRTLIHEDTTQSGVSIILQDLRIKSQGSEGGEGRKGGREVKEDRKAARRWKKSNIELKLSNFRYHRNCFWDFRNKLQINAVKNTCDQTSSDKAPFNYILKIILNKKNKIWNKNELLDVFPNKGSTESKSTRIVNTSCLTENIDWRGYNRMVCQPSCRISAIKVGLQNTG